LLKGHAVLHYIKHYHQYDLLSMTKIRS